MAGLPKGYGRLEDSELHPHSAATLLGPSNADEHLSVTITLRRRTDGHPMPDFNYFLTTPITQRQRLPNDIFAARYGASTEDIDLVTNFATANNLIIVNTNAARRSVVVSGTVGQMEAAFALKLGSYKHEVPLPGAQPRTETYRARDGFVNVPIYLVEVITGVFGLDNRRIAERIGRRGASSHALTGVLNDAASAESLDARSAAPPHNSSTIPPDKMTVTVPQMTQIYDFPDNSAAGQTIAIVAEVLVKDYKTPECGYQESDIEADFKEYLPGVTPPTHGDSPPTLTDVSVDGSVNPGTAGGETTMDILVAASAAPGASIAVYFFDGSEDSWVNLVKTVAHPGPDQPICSVLSSSWTMSMRDGYIPAATKAWITELHATFQDAAIQGVTVCQASGDWGADSYIGDGRPHVMYPASDPWVLSVGGTRVSNVEGNTCTETVWNDGNDYDGDVPPGATGGGISEQFPVPAYQSRFVNVPRSLNNNFAGRGIPDVAANGSYTAYDLFIGGTIGQYGGTSAAAPLWAAFVAVINAALKSNVGFINADLYAAGSASGIFRDITASTYAADNTFMDDGTQKTAQGYPALAGWDCCTGWGVMNGTAFLNYFSAAPSDIYIRDYDNDDGSPTIGLTYMSPDIIVRQSPVSNPQASFGQGSGTEHSSTLSQDVVQSQDQYVYVRLYNKGVQQAIDVTATVYYSPPSTFLDPSQWKEIGSIVLPAVPGSQVLTVSGAITWPQADIPTPEHYCFIALVGDDANPTPTIPTSLDNLAEFIQTNKQVAMCNFNVIAAPPPAPMAAVQDLFSPDSQQQGTDSAGASIATFHSFPFNIPGSSDDTHVFRIETNGTLPDDSQVDLYIPEILAQQINVQISPGSLVPAEDGSTNVVLQCPPSGNHVIGSGPLEKGSVAKCKLLVKVAADVYESNEINRFDIRQIFEDKEVGRVTWHFGQRDEVVE